MGIPAALRARQTHHQLLLGEGEGLACGHEPGALHSARCAERLQQQREEEEQQQWQR